MNGRKGVGWKKHPIPTNSVLSKTKLKTNKSLHNYRNSYIKGIRDSHQRNVWLSLLPRVVGRTKSFIGSEWRFHLG